MTHTADQNPMLPYLGEISEVRDLASEIKLFPGQDAERGRRGPFADYKARPFAFVSAFGYGEAPFGIANNSAARAVSGFAINRLGNVTTALHELGVGEHPRGARPMGNCFPMEEFRGKNIIVIGGGIGGAPAAPGDPANPRPASRLRASDHLVGGAASLPAGVHRRI